MFSVQPSNRDIATAPTYRVSVLQMECSCGRWYQVGIPCIHALAVICKLSYNSVSNADLFYSHTFFYEGHLHKRRVEMFRMCNFAGQFPGDDEIQQASTVKTYSPLRIPLINVEGEFLSEKRIQSQGETVSGKKNKTSTIKAKAVDKKRRTQCSYCGKIAGRDHDVRACLRDIERQREAAETIFSLKVSTTT